MYKITIEETKEIMTTTGKEFTQIDTEEVGCSTDTKNNRIGDDCWFRVLDYASRTWSVWTKGVLRAWSTDHIDGEAGFGLFPVGVVENVTTGRCVSTPVAEIIFSDDEPEA